MRNETTVAAALFDLDGVVLDTESQYSTFWDEIGKAYYPEMPGFAHLIKGQTDKQIFSAYFPHEEDWQRIKQAQNTFEAQMEYNFIPGVERFIAELRREGIPTAIVTSSGRSKMEKVYSHHPSLKEQFSHIFTAEDCKRSKPYPDCYLAGADFFQVPPERCVVFEDSINGLKAGRNAGMAVVGLTTTFPVEDVEPLCDKVIPDFRDFDYATFQSFFASFGRKD